MYKFKFVSTGLATAVLIMLASSGFTQLYDATPQPDLSLHTNCLTCAKV